MRSLLATAALGAALGAALFLVLAPSYTERMCTVTAGGEEVCISSSRSLAEENGDWVLAFVALPVTLTALVFVSATGLLPLPRAIGWAAVFVLLAGCLITGFSIGLLFVPAALLALAAMILSTARRDRAPAP